MKAEKLTFARAKVRIGLKASNGQIFLTNVRLISAISKAEIDELNC
jgi:hypothetical protein